MTKEIHTKTPSRFIAFFDECGDHSLEKIDQNFPLFVLSTVIFERSEYIEKIVPKIARLKLKFWNHEGVNLHSRDIRKALGDFSFMRVPAPRSLFLQDLDDVMQRINFTLFLTVIHKQSHKNRYRQQAANPYDLALSFTFERVLHFLESFGESELPVTAEARGANEDNELIAAFYRLMTQGTNFNSAERFKKLNCNLTFRKKSDNVAGMQIADLCAYPTARHVLSPGQKNGPFGIVSTRIYRNNRVNGFKIFP